MPDRVVTWRAIADFSKVRSEAAKTQASLSSLQKQIDKNNASNVALGDSSEAASAKTQKSNNAAADSFSKAKG
jgi:hypothetical protein